MLANRFKLLYLPENLSTIKEFRFSRSKVFFMAGIFTVFFISLVLSLTVLALKLFPDYQYRVLSQENRLLLEDIYSAQKEIGVLQAEISELTKTDEHLRLITDLPLIDEATRKAGIGGSLPARGIDPAQDLRIYLDQLERQVEIQKESYPEILRKIEKNLDVATHTPAICPVEKIRLTSGYGWRKDPFTGVRKPHHGVDFGAPRGTTVYATADGVVTMVKRIDTFGKIIRIDHGYGYETVYGHLQSFNVRLRQKVKRGDLIGTVGNTGRSTAPHLHYEVRVNKEPVNPMDYLFDESLAKIR